MLTPSRGTLILSKEHKDLSAYLPDEISSMNIFETHSSIVSDYENYITSFLKIADPTIRKKVEAELSQGKLWPEPLLQFNPSFEMPSSSFRHARR